MKNFLKSKFYLFLMGMIFMLPLTVFVFVFFPRDVELNVKGGLRPPPVTLSDDKEDGFGVMVALTKKFETINKQNFNLLEYYESR